MGWFWDEVYKLMGSRLGAPEKPRPKRIDPVSEQDTLCAINPAQGVIPMGTKGSSTMANTIYDQSAAYQGATTGHGGMGGFPLYGGTVSTTTGLVPTQPSWSQYIQSAQPQYVQWGGQLIPAEFISAGEVERALLPEPMFTEDEIEQAREFIEG